MKWETRFGPHGFPGWHIECSAMARELLGDHLDIHTGGEDNVFPHHECEIAQSEAFTGQPFARYWMHSKFLQVDGGKMSKSLGNVYTLDDVRAHGYTPRQLRFALIRGHYGSPLNFTWEILKSAASGLENLDDLVVRLRRIESDGGGAADPRAGMELVEQARARFDEAMQDDLNLPEALPPLYGLRDQLLAGALGRAAAGEALAFVGRANGVLGVMDMEAKTIDAEIQAMIAARERARGERDFRGADRIRDELLARGIELQDTPAGVVWRRRS